MIEKITAYEVNGGDLGTLVSQLRGLFVEADPHDMRIRSEFESMWAPIDGEHELRTEAWAPAGSANDDRLGQLLHEFRIWAETVIAADASDDHR
jgi:hypothetical protein